jgi:hypothetical protein
MALTTAGSGGFLKLNSDHNRLTQSHAESGNNTSKDKVENTAGIAP